MPQDNCPLGIQNNTRIDHIETEIKEVREAIKDMRDRLLGRPSWVVLFMFTAMSSIIVGLILKITEMASK